MARRCTFEDIPAGSSAIPTEVQEGELDFSPHAVISGDVIQPGLEMVVEVDPDGTLDPNLGVSKRIPESGRMTVDVRAVPPLLWTLIPFVSTVDNDREAVTVVANADRDDEIFWQTNHYLPVGELEITPHESVTVDTNDIFELLSDVGTIRLMEDGVGHWMGLIPDPEGAAGVAWLPFGPDSLLWRGKTSVSNLSPETIAHELGHNLSLRHADCGDPAGADPSFPHDNARSGVWGWDPRDGGSLVTPDRADFMSYCNPTWVSDYYFTNALRFRLQDPLEVWETPAASRTLLVSGGVTADGDPWLDPAFVVETRPVVPTAGGPWQLSGRRADGRELFSLSFGMAELWDGDGRSGFAFALPVEPEWEAELASLLLSGPDGSVEMTEGSESPVAILRDPRTRQVRAIFRDLPTGPLALSSAEDRAPEPGLQVLVSSGLPDAEAWRR
ncbi:MAG: M66 family metalloprotease [Gemmatimonadota bacterium]|nr:M66 family metalloprotease [Gemmatimonadota bacterium]